MRIVPRRLGGIRVVLDVLDVFATLEQQHAESFLRELFRGPTAGDAGAHHDGIVIRRLHDSLLYRETYAASVLISRRTDSISSGLFMIPAETRAYETLYGDVVVRIFFS